MPCFAHFVQFLPQIAALLCLLKIYSEMRSEESLIQCESMRLECSFKGVLRENVLRSCMADRHWRGLQGPTVRHTEYWKRKKRVRWARVNRRRWKLISFCFWNYSQTQGHPGLHFDKRVNLMTEWLGLGSSAFLKRETDENEGKTFTFTHCKGSSECEKMWKLKWRQLFFVLIFL